MDPKVEETKSPVTEVSKNIAISNVAESTGNIDENVFQR